MHYYALIFSAILAAPLMRVNIICIKIRIFGGVIGYLFINIKITLDLPNIYSSKNILGFLRKKIDNACINM